MYLAPEIFGLVELLTVRAVDYTLVEVFGGIYGDKNYVDVYVMYFNFICLFLGSCMP